MWCVKFAINIKMCSEGYSGGAVRGCSCLNCINKAKGTNKATRK